VLAVLDSGFEDLLAAVGALIGCGVVGRDVLTLLLLCPVWRVALLGNAAGLLAGLSLLAGGTLLGVALLVFRGFVGVVWLLLFGGAALGMAVSGYGGRSRGGMRGDGLLRHGGGLCKVLQRCVDKDEVNDVLRLRGF
jgi:hypothetical protein